MRAAEFTYVEVARVPEGTADLVGVIEDGEALFVGDGLGGTANA